MQQGASLDAMASSVAVGIDSMSKIRVFLTDDQPIVCRGISLLLQEDPNIEIVGGEGDFFNSFAKSLSVGKAIEGVVGKSSVVQDVLQRLLAGRGSSDMPSVANKGDADA